MGWLKPKKQKEVLKKYRVDAMYMCDYCHKPIQIGELPVIDRKKGYHHWSSKIPNDCRPFLGKNPRVTYHQIPCDALRQGKKPKYNSGEDTMPKEKKSKKSSKKEKKSKKKSTSASPAVMKSVMKLVDKKPGHYGKRDLFRKLKDDHDKGDVRDAIEALWAQGKLRKKEGAYIPFAKKVKADKDDE
jgi:hypothetical protein